MIVVFGTKRCKHCKTQQKYFKNTFGSKGWMYSDVLEDEVLKIAEEIDVENIPTTIIFNKQGNEIWRQEGILPPDQAFKIIHSEKSIPVKKSEIKKIKSNSKNKVYLSYKPNLKIGDQVEIKTYGGDKIINAKILNITEMDIKALPLVYQSQYLNSGGRKDRSWMIEIKNEER